MKVFQIPLPSVNAHMTAFIHDRSDEAKNMPWQPETRPAVLIAPGGSYMYVSEREADPVAQRFMVAGYNAFVLHYSVGDAAVFPDLVRQASMAVATIRMRAEEFGVNPEQIATMGFSAGGNLVGMLGNLWQDPAFWRDLGLPEGSNKPNAQVLCYAVLGGRQGAEPLMAQMREAMAQKGLPTDDMHVYHALLQQARVPVGKLFYQYPDAFVVNEHVNANTPASFIWHTRLDRSVPVVQALNMALALEKQKIPYELHVFEEGTHGLATVDELSCYGRQLPKNPQQWIPLAVAWLHGQLHLGENLPHALAAKPAV